MAYFTIMTDSSCDLPASVAEQLHIRVSPLSVFADGKQYYNFLDGSHIGFEEFYSILKAGSLVTTSAVNVAQFKTMMEAELIAGHDVLYIGFSSGLSGTYNAAVQAAAELEGAYPGKKILTVDSLCASLGQGMLVYLAIMQKRAGKTIDEVLEYIEETKMKVCHWFTVDDLYQLKRGGRISGAKAVLGSMLNIKPILRVDNNGKLENVEKARGRNASINTLFEKFEKDAVDPESQVVFISHGNCREDADKLAKMIKDKYGCKVIINFVGPTIGAHSGQGTLALFFLGNER